MHCDHDTSISCFMQGPRQDLWRGVSGVMLIYGRFYFPSTMGHLISSKLMKIRLNKTKRANTLTFNFCSMRSTKNRISLNLTDSKHGLKVTKSITLMTLPNRLSVRSSLKVKIFSDMRLSAYASQILINNSIMNLFNNINCNHYCSVFIT